MRRGRSPRTTVIASSHRRMKVGFVLIVMVLSLFGARLVQLQGVDPGQYAAMAAREGSRSVVLPAARGDILDRDGEPLAGSVDGLMVIADPALTRDDAPALAALLSKRLDVDYFTTLRRLEADGSRFEYVARQVPAARAERVIADAADLVEKRMKEEGEEVKPFGGLTTREDPLRIYPGGDVAANLVGVLGTPLDDGTARPSAGLEATFNDYLAGTNGTARYQTGGGNRIPLGDNTVTDAVDGHALTTTIDRDLQWYTQRVLRQTVLGAGGDSGYAVVMDSKTGELLSLADYPTFDASDPGESDPDDFGSKAVSDIYEPGSVEKVLTVSGLVDAGKVTDRTQFTVPSILEREGDDPIGDYFEHGLLRLTMAGIIAKSSNIGTVLASERYDPGQLRSYLRGFGLGEKTDIGLAGEQAGLLPSGAAWTDPVGARIAFGQSVSVNAVQMTAAVNTIANGGVRVDPSLVKGHAKLNDGTEIGSDLSTTRRVVSADAARQTQLMMERVLDPEEGVAPSAAVPGYRVAGKTGTAQRVVDGRYDGSLTVSFAGFAPADKPRFTIYVAVQNPRAGSGGGSVGGPAFSKLMTYALRHFGVEPTGTPPSRLPVEW